MSFKFWFGIIFTLFFFQLVLWCSFDLKPFFWLFCWCKSNIFFLFLWTGFSVHIWRKTIFFQLVLWCIFFILLFLFAGSMVHPEIKSGTLVVMSHSLDHTIPNHRNLILILFYILIIKKRIEWILDICMTRAVLVHSPNQEISPHFLRQIQSFPDSKS